MSKIYQIGEPVFMGNIPVRTEIEVLPADEPKQLQLGFKVYEVRGGEIWRVDDETRTPIVNRDDLKIGDEIIVPTLLGHVKMTVSELNGDEGTAESAHTIGMLNFGIDSRNAWTSDMSMNKKAFKKAFVEK